MEMKWTFDLFFVCVVVIGVVRIFLVFCPGPVCLGRTYLEHIERQHISYNHKPLRCYKVVIHRGGLRISSLLSVDDVLLLDSLGHDLLALEQREAGMRIRTSKMEITYFCWKRVECSF